MTLNRTSFKGAVALVDIKLVGGRVVDNNQIEQVIIVDVNERRGETIVLLWVVNSGLYTDVFKSPVGLLMIERVAFTAQASRSAHNRHAAELTEVPADPPGVPASDGLGGV